MDTLYADAGVPQSKIPSTWINAEESGGDEMVLQVRSSKTVFPVRQYEGNSTPGCDTKLAPPP